MSISSHCGLKGKNATLGPVGLEGALTAKALSISGELYLSLPNCKTERKGNNWAPANVLGDGLEGSCTLLLRILIARGEAEEETHPGRTRVSSKVPSQLSGPRRIQT